MLEWLKKFLRFIRAQWHGDIYDKFKIADQLENLGQNQAVALNTHEIMKTMAQWQTAALCNQISLANKKPGRRTIYTPWAPRKTLYLAVGQDGRLCFYPSDKSGPKAHGIFTNTMPKAGTHFLGAVLQALGFQDIPGIFGGGRSYTDWRGMSHEVQQATPDAFYASLPFNIQMDMVQPGQYLLAHLEYETVIEARLQGLDSILLLVRDLRHALVSHLRHTRRKNVAGFLPVSHYSSEELHDYLKAGGDSAFLFRVAEGCVRLQKESWAYLVRYEDLLSHDKDGMLPSLKAISAVTGAPADDVFKAVEAKNGASTPTQTNDHVTLDTIWTKEVEELFIAKGGDVLNEKLGYPREYIPKS